MRKKIMGFILAVSTLLALTPDTVMAAKMEETSLSVQETAEQAADEGIADTSSEMEGVGTETAPYRIKNAEQLRAFADMVNGADGAPDTGICAVLTCNIDLSGVCGADIDSWTPIGTNVNPYTGIFDGGSFAITGLYYHKSNSSYVGLFGYNAGVIKNLGVAGADIAADSYTGGVCGYNSGIITGCYNAASVKGTDYTGGVCGYNNVGGTVSICYNIGAVSGRKYVGGICGYNKNTTADCYNMGAVNGKRTSIGGICGYNRALVSNCFNTGTVNGDGKKYIGSVCGYNHSQSSFLNCYYLITGEEKGNYGVAMTQEQFASGEVCWLLNDGKIENVVWRQTCGAGFPAFGGKVVYQVRQPKTGGSADEMIVAYANEAEKKQAAYNASAEEGNSENTDGHVYQEPEWEWKEYSSAKAVFTCQDCGEKLTLDASISKKTTKATCGKEGENVYTASVDRDGETYTDKKTEKLEKPEHQALVQISAKDAKCTESGIKQGCWQCPDCGEYFDDQERTKVLSRKEVVEPAKGHQYSDLNDPVWTWADGYATATATFTCTACHQTADEKATVTFKTTASCTTEGKTVYTAVVRFKNKTYKKEETVNNEKIPHSYGNPKWDWKGGFSNVTAMFTCKKCHENVSKDATLTSEKITESTCKVEGKIKHTAVVDLDGMKYSDVKTETLEKKKHNYGTDDPEWSWNLKKNPPTATATFTCTVCQTPISKTVEATKEETSGTTCETPRKVTYTASVTFNETTYTKQKDEELPAEHTLSHVAKKSPTCVETGNDEYWKCSVCSSYFGDAAGSKNFTGSLVIPTIGHTLKQVNDTLYQCTACGGKYTIAISSDGTPTMYSVEEDAVIVQDETENSEEKQEDTESQSEDEQDGETGQSEQKGQDGEVGQSGPEDQNEQNIQNEQDGQSEQNEDESSDDIPDMLENAARYGLIYPEGEGEEANPETADAWEESVIDLRAKSAENAAVEIVREQQQQQGYPLWISVAVLSVLAGVVLILFCKGKAIDDKR